ncbi:MAG: hypothetical protein Q8P57_03330 [Candidatus Pacearchaeota archaeon]|nr:hypothetical protein [Candidatus Pacearchaeota archaeon]
MKVIKEFRNDLLKRNEIEVAKNYESNPGFEKVMAEVSSQFKSDADRISIKKISNGFGSNEFIINLLIYDSSDDLKRIETRNRKKKGDKK